jgi:putative membrane protein
MPSLDPSPSLRRSQLIEIAVVTLAALSLAIGSPYPDQMPLQHSATVLLCGYLVHQTWTGRLRNLELRCLLGFLLLHAFAARWIYSYVPYDRWSQSLFGISITRTFHFRRNHFDRLVHFLYGVLVTPHMVRKFSGRVSTPAQSRYFALEFVGFTSLLYELFEWALTLVLSPDDIESYNGQQGDAWDSQKDMLCALVGCLAVVGPWQVVSMLRRPTGSSSPSES